MSEVRDSIDGAALLRWGWICLAGLEQRREEINALNVFPIADSDTGTNMLATMRAAVREAEAGGAPNAGGAPDIERADTGGELLATTRAVCAEAANGPQEVEEAERPTVDGGSPPRLAAADSRTGGVRERLARHSDAHRGLEEAALRIASGRTAREIAAAMARGATRGARGNSGIILSQVLRGIAEAARGGPLTADTVCDALSTAAALVRGALSVPVEGTILTVLECAAASADAVRGGDLAAVALAAADGAAKALGETPSQLGVLRDAGVVDAGARGLVVLLDSLVSVARGEAPARPDYVRGAAVAAGASAPGDFETATPEAHFEVMYLLAGTDERRVSALRDQLGALGDSVVVVGDGAETWSTHVHCADAGAAIEAGLAAGTVSAIRIESFAITAVAPDDVALSRASTVRHGAACSRDADRPLGAGSSHGAGLSSEATVPGPASARGGAVTCAETAARRGVISPRDSLGGLAGRGAARRTEAVADRAVLAVAAGEGAAALFEAAGAVVLGGDDPVTSAALLTAIRRMPNREVLVLPNGALPAHELVAVGVAARDARRDVLMLPSGSMVQGMAALAVHDRGRIAVDDAFAMSEAAAATRWGSLRAATGRALTMVGTCEAGDGLALVGHDVVVIERGVLAAGRTLLDRMLGLGGELVTLLMGVDAPAELGAELAAHIARGFPGVEVAVYSGGQRGDLVQIGVE
ncbi:DAK2 domain-containing protein [Nocardia bovistercoris]|uniref:DAK2 domain-containing protein n=1 Tax=Nocardia bovistercoris TaxID=2785916 RepID=UPI002FCCD5F7